MFAFIWRLLSPSIPGNTLACVFALAAVGAVISAGLVLGASYLVGVTLAVAGGLTVTGLETVGLGVICIVLAYVVVNRILRR